MKQAVVLTCLALLSITAAARAEVTIVDLGTGAPPVMLGPYPMTPFDIAPQAAIEDGSFVYYLSGGPAYDLYLYPDLIKKTVPISWPKWSHGYEGPVFSLSGSEQISISNLYDLSAFYFYVQPLAGVQMITITAGSETFGPIAVSGDAGARGFGVYSTGGSLSTGIEIYRAGVGGEFAVAEFGAADRQALCSIMSIPSETTVEGMWTGDCGSRYNSQTAAQLFTFTLDRPTPLEIVLEAPRGQPGLVLFEGEGTLGAEIASAREFYSFPGHASLRLDLNAGTYTVEASDGSYQSTNPFSLRLRPLAGICTGSASTLCVNKVPQDQRFKVGVFYSSFVAGLFGNAQLAQSGFERGGVFWFFNQDNPEVMVKVLNGCPVNGHVWVFISAVTNVGFTVTVTDMVTGQFWGFENPDQHAAIPQQDTKAFVCSD